MKKLCLILLLLSTLPVYAADPTPIGRFGHWRVFSVIEGDKKMCFMATSPQQTTKQRDNNYLTISRRKNAPDEIAVMFGVNYHKTSQPTLGIDNQKVIGLKTDNDASFFTDLKAQELYIQKMIIGNVARTVGKSERGTILRETFSLKGFANAYNALKNACPVE